MTASPPGRRTARPGSPAAPGEGAARVRWRRAFLLALVVQLVVLYAPSAPSTGEVHGIDKVVHLTVFAVPVLAGLVAGLPAPLLLVVMAAHGPLSEVVQAAFLPHRDGNVYDAVADIAGVAVGALVYVVGRRRGRW